VEIGAPSAVASALVPPNLSIISEIVMQDTSTENRNDCNSDVLKSSIYPEGALGQLTTMLTQGDLLARLEALLGEKKISQADIARAIDIHPSGVTSLLKPGGRKLKLDEAVKLVEAFDLESPPSQRVPPLSGRISRLIVMYVAGELGVSQESHREQLEELAEDVRAFAELVADPKYRDSVEAAEAFFQAMRLRRPKPGQADPQGSDHHNAD
jgi:predicted XRE-type DNA-binding protein